MPVSTGAGRECSLEQAAHQGSKIELLSQIEIQSQRQGAGGAAHGQEVRSLPAKKATRWRLPKAGSTNRRKGGGLPFSMPVGLEKLSWQSSPMGNSESKSRGVLKSNLRQSRSILHTPAISYFLRLLAALLCVRFGDCSPMCPLQPTGFL